jgi:hypothetical protein
MPEAGTPVKLGSAIDWQKLTGAAPTSSGPF